MTKLKLLALGVFIATSASVAHAESNLTLGAGVGVVEHPYKDYDSDVYPIPVIAYESENFWFRGLGGGYYLWNDNADKLSIMAYWSPMYFKPGDSDDHQLRRLDRRKSTMMAGVSYAHHTQYGFLRTSLAGDTLDNSNGIVWDLARLYRYTNGGLTLTPVSGLNGIARTRTITITAYHVKNLRVAACAAITRTIAGTRILNLALTIISPVTGAYMVLRATPACRMKLPTTRWWINHGPVSFLLA